MAIMSDSQCASKRCRELARYHCIDHSVWRNGTSYTRRCGRYLCAKHYAKHEGTAYHVTRNS